MHYCSDHEVQFYEMVNFEPYCQLRRLESVPLKLDFWLVTASQVNTLSVVYTVMQTLSVCLRVCQFVFLLPFLCRSDPEDHNNCLILVGDKEVTCASPWQHMCITATCASPWQHMCIIATCASPWQHMYHSNMCITMATHVHHSNMSVTMALQQHMHTIAYAQHK